MANLLHWPHVVLPGTWAATLMILIGAEAALHNDKLAMLCYARWRAWERSVRFVAVWGAFVVLTAFYSIPIIAIQGLINIDQLRKIHAIAVIIDLSFVRSVITAILPGTSQF